jgi:membrane-bound metal-dependent hydrolase YbcI (DUF457 family)
VDVLSHGLWGSALFGHKSKWQWRWAFLLGAAPDIIAFGPFLISQLGSASWVEFPRYVYQSYNVTHSLVVWAAVAAGIWLFKRSFPWIFCAWGLHILCDIPLHEIDFFPTPYLWPFKTHFVNGLHWAQLWVMIPNYVALAITYAVWMDRRRRKPAVPFAEGDL